MRATDEGGGIRVVFDWLAGEELLSEAISGFAIPIAGYLSFGRMNPPRWNAIVKTLNDLSHNKQRYIIPLEQYIAIASLSYVYSENFDLFLQNFYNSFELSSWRTKVFVKMLV